MRRQWSKERRGGGRGGGRGRGRVGGREQRTGAVDPGHGLEYAASVASRSEGSEATILAGKTTTQ